MGRNETKTKIYIAGPMFDEAAIAARIRDRKMIEKAFELEHITNYYIYNPIEAPFNDKSTLPTAEAIYIGDRDKALGSDIIFAVLDGEDAGVMAELGMIATNPEIEVFAVLSDMRIGTNGDYDDHRVPFGYNQFITGMIEVEKKGNIFYSTEDAIYAMVDSIIRK